jgi:hypothetical protein
MAPAATQRRARPDIVHSSLYLPQAVYEALRNIAHEERRKIHDLVLDGIDAVLKKNDYPSAERRKAKAGK